MFFNNEQISFSIPSLNYEWIYPVVISFNKIENCFYVEVDDLKNKNDILYRATIFHTISGDINRFDITCSDFTTQDESFKNLINPIFTKYCKENLIDLKFDVIDYD